jgi:ubiquinone/menaquinone biosynthesis C-methylase UbiE
MDESEFSSLFFDQIAPEFAGGFSNPSEHLDEFLKNVPNNGSILDVACGVGTNADYMHSKDYRVIGIDLSRGMLKIARQRYPQLDFRLMDMRKMAFNESSFDGILASYALVNIPKRDISPIFCKKFISY